MWDLPTRLFHWLFAISMVGAYFSGENDLIDWHARLGLVIAGLLLFRFFWGLFGPHAARFSTMLEQLSQLRPYLWQGRAQLKALRHGQPAPLSEPQIQPQLGHNPLGVISVFAILAIATVSVISGLFNTDDVLFEGPLYPLAPGLSPLMSEIHELVYPLFLIWVAAHILALIIHQWVLKEKLVERMSLAPAQQSHPSTERGTLFWGLSLLSACQASVWLSLGL